jgi:hypothetical protein
MQNGRFFVNFKFRKDRDVILISNHGYEGSKLNSPYNLGAIPPQPGLRAVIFDGCPECLRRSEEKRGHPKAASVNSFADDFDQHPFVSHPVIFT